MSLEGKIPLVDRLFKRAVPHGKCLLWAGKTDPYGYGILRIGSKEKGYHNPGAHKVAYILMKADVPPGMHVMHSCDNPTCINPLHLSVGTPRDNVYDSIAKGRHVYNRQHFYPKKPRQVPVKEPSDTAKDHNLNISKLLPSTKAAFSSKPVACSYSIVVVTTRMLALQSGSKVYVGRECVKHKMAWRRTTNGECIYCRYEYRKGVLLVPNRRG